MFIYAHNLENNGQDNHQNLMEQIESDVGEGKENDPHLLLGEEVLAESIAHLSGRHKGEDEGRPRVGRLDYGQVGVDEVAGAVDVLPQGVGQHVAYLFHGEHPVLGPLENLLGCIPRGLLLPHALLVAKGGLLKDHSCRDVEGAEGVGLHTIVSGGGLEVGVHAGAHNVPMLGHGVSGLIVVAPMVITAKLTSIPALGGTPALLQRISILPPRTSSASSHILTQFSLDVTSHLVKWMLSLPKLSSFLSCSAASSPLAASMSLMTTLAPSQRRRLAN